MDNKNRKFLVSDKDHIRLPVLHDFSELWENERINDILENWWQSIDWLPEENAITELDIFSLPIFRSNQQIEDFIFDKLWIDINNSQEIRKINDFFIKAQEFYKEKLQRHIPKEMAHISFNHKKDIFWFIKNTSQWKKRQSYCNIVKIIFLIWELERCEELKDIDKKAKIAIRDEFRFLQIDDPKFPFSKSQTTWNVIIGDTIIRFNLCFRAKSELSNILKMGYNPEYYSADLIRDAIWIQFEVTNPDDVVIIQSIIYEKLWHHDSEYTLKDKSFLSLHSNKIHNLIHPDFMKHVRRCEDKPTSEDEKKSNTSEKYRDLKSIFFMRVRKNPDKENSQKIKASFEIKTVLKDNRNDSWLSNHAIYDYFKRILFTIRLQWYVTESYLKCIINKMFDDNPEMEFNKQEILDHYKQCLGRVNIRWSKIVYYVSKERRKTLSHADSLWYPERFLET